MGTRIQLGAATILLMTVGNAVAQDETALVFEDFIGVWNFVYADGQTGVFTISTNEDGDPEVVVTMASESEGHQAQDVLIENDAITFRRTVTLMEQDFNVNYTAILVDGKLEAEGVIDFVEPQPESPFRAMTVPFTATRSE